MALSWKEITKASEAAGFYHGVGFAEDNANDTLYVEKNTTVSFDDICLATLAEQLAFGTLEPEEHAFFVKLGVQF